MFPPIPIAFDTASTIRFAGIAFGTISTQRSESALASAERRHICRPEDLLRIFFDRGDRTNLRPR